MSRLHALPEPARIHAGALIVAAVGFVILFTAGIPELQPFPPGLVLLLAVAAATLAWPGQRWPAVVGTLSCVWILVGAFLLYPGTLERLADPAAVVLFAGTVVQIGGVAVAAVSGAVRAASPRVVSPAR